MQFRNLSNVRRLGETPEAYILSIEIDDGDGWEAAEFVARVGGGGLCDPILAAIAADEFAGSVTDYVPDPEPVPAVVTALQFITAAAVPQDEYPEALRPATPRETGWITEAEAEAWGAANALPAVVVAVIDSLPTAERFPARMKALRMTSVSRTEPLIVAAVTALGGDSEDADALFHFAATL